MVAASVHESVQASAARREETGVQLVERWGVEWVSGLGAGWGAASVHVWDAEWANPLEEVTEAPLVKRKASERAGCSVVM